MNFVLGARGRLGHAIHVSHLVDHIEAPDHSVYADWWREGSENDAARYFGSRATQSGTVYVAIGIIDPRRSHEEHLRINFDLAKNVVRGATRVGLKVITFGTVMEKVVDDKGVNPYFASKSRLGRFVEDAANTSELGLHIRLHTLFGGRAPDPFMFLGQILQAVQTGTEFRMTPGMQLREYHHIDDEVAAIFRLNELRHHGSVELSHGAPVTLKTLATHVFDAYQCTELLKIGALPEPVNDNYSFLFERTAMLDDINFRPTLPAIVEYLRSIQPEPMKSRTP